MEVLFILPQLTGCKSDNSSKFFKACIEEVEDYLLDFSTIKNLNHIQRGIDKLNSNLLLVVFNNEINECPNEVVSLVKNARDKGAIIWPIAMEREYRNPMCEISTRQSFDVFEQLRCRNLNEDYIYTVGKVFARKIISQVLPTMYRDNNLLFVSHRRIDGEDIAAKFCDQLSIQAKAQNSFRDVVNVEVGEAAQDIIDTALTKSDVLIFIHTQLSSQSEWIKKELIYAALHNIPIVWVRVDEASPNDLYIKPSDKPHIECNSEDFDNKEKLIELVDEILDKSFKLTMLNYNMVYDQINRFQDFCNSSKLNLIKEDNTNLIYNLILPRKGYAYPQRDINHYIQYFGRRCREEDVDNMKSYLKAKSYDEQNLYDSAILISDKFKVREYKEFIVEDNYDDFYRSWDEYTTSEKYCTDDEIIISGSFPECDEIYKKSLYDAVSIFSKEILKNGFKLTFGSHPTFQNLIFEIGKKFREDDYQYRINMYISKLFKYNITTLRENATVTETEVVEAVEVEERSLKSLTNMREKMIKRDSVKALICLGGVIRDDNTNQGIDEEIKLARENNIPVFIIGSVGGRSSQIASEYIKNERWKEINSESDELNEELALSLDYMSLANKVISSIRNN